MKYLDECLECGGKRIEKLILYRCPDCGAEYTSTLDRWISVEDRLPVRGEDVWIYWRDKQNKLNVKIGWLIEKDNVFQYILGYDVETLWHKVLGWMPVQIPEPPEFD